MMPAHQRPDYGAEYIPTPAEIEAACKAIRSTWDRRTHMDRAGYSRCFGRVELELVKVADVEAVLAESRA